MLLGVKETIVIEQGIQLKEIKKALNYDLSNVACGLLSHEHGDHSKSSVDFAEMGIFLYTSQGTIDKLKKKSHFIKPVHSEQIIETEEFKILCFDTQHDCAEPLGFLIYNKIEHKKILFATDTYYLKYKFKKVDCFIIEVNYIKRLLDENVNLPEMVRNRILTSHFSLDNVIKFLSISDLSITKLIIPVHLSDENADEREIKQVLEDQFNIQVHCATGEIIEL